MIRKIRGMLLNYALDIIKDKHEKKISKEIFKSKEKFSNIYPDKFYDIALYEYILLKLERLYGQKECIDISKRLADRAMDKEFGYFRHFVSYQHLLNNHQKFWNMAYDSGNFRILEATDRSLKAKVMYFPITEIHRYALAEFMRRFIEVISKKKVVGTSLSIDNNTTEFSFYFH